MDDRKIKCPYGDEACTPEECILFGKCRATREQYPHKEYIEED